MLKRFSSFCSVEFLLRDFYIPQCFASCVSPPSAVWNLVDSPQDVEILHQTRANFLGISTSKSESFKGGRDVESLVLAPAEDQVWHSWLRDFYRQKLKITMWGNLPSYALQKQEFFFLKVIFNFGAAALNVTHFKYYLRGILSPAPRPVPPL